MTTADIKVHIPGLLNFKETVGTSWKNFDQIKIDLDNHLNRLRAQDWVTEGAEDFQVVFNKSKTDIDNLVETMRKFETYLGRKIDQATSINQHKVSM
jgi:uncharacterized protein YukE